VPDLHRGDHAARSSRRASGAGVHWNGLDGPERVPGTPRLGQAMLMRESTLVPITA